MGSLCEALPVLGVLGLQQGPRNTVARTHEPLPPLTHPAGKMQVPSPSVPALRGRAEPAQLLWLPPPQPTPILALPLSLPWGLPHSLLVSKDSEPTPTPHNMRPV